MFEKASRLKFRFESPIGLLSVEELWDIPLTSSPKKANLDDVAKGLHRQLKSGDDVSFVLKEKKSDEVTQLKFDIVRHIIGVRLAENEVVARARENAEKKQRILEIIAGKEDEAMSGKSVDELRVLAATLQELKEMTNINQAEKTESIDRCSPSKVSMGSTYSRHSFGTVTGISGNRYSIQNEQGTRQTIDSEILAKEFTFADQHDQEEVVSRTRAIEILGENPRTAMTIRFNKAPDPKAISEKLKGGQGDMGDREWKRFVSELVAGEERTMIGWHFGSWDEHRRLQFIEKSKGPRLVDVRTLSFVLVNRVKYVVK